MKCSLEEGILDIAKVENANINVFCVCVDGSVVSFFLYW